jgi:L-lactate permease
LCLLRRVCVYWFVRLHSAIFKIQIQVIFKWKYQICMVSPDRIRHTNICKYTNKTIYYINLFNWVCSVFSFYSLQAISKIFEAILINTIWFTALQFICKQFQNINYTYLCVCNMVCECVRVRIYGYELYAFHYNILVSLVLLIILYW